MNNGSRAACKNCRFFLVGQGHLGACRRYPPTVVLVPAPQRVANAPPQFTVDGAYVPVRDDFWCGEYQRVVVVADMRGLQLAVDTAAAS